MHTASATHKSALANHDVLPNVLLTSCSPDLAESVKSLLRQAQNLLSLTLARQLAESDTTVVIAQLELVLSALQGAFFNCPDSLKVVSSRQFYHWYFLID
jgi:hypothetical protein